MTTATSSVSADSNGTPTTVGGDIERLNPTDGLFLRAQHLQAMQDYARELALSVGVAAGGGVVWGYRVWLDGPDTLKISDGLALAPDGRPLRSRHTAVIDLTDVAGRDDGFWIVEVRPAAWLYGEENTYGNLCDDPCSTGSPIRPYQAEGVQVRLRDDTMPGLSSRPTTHQRNWLASQYFERERERRGTWLLPDGSGAAITSILARDWAKPIGEPMAAAQADDAVAIAALLRVDSDWVLDVWTARRDLGDPAPRRGWQDRLGMRPWDVFLAQVLQFEAQLAAVLPAAKAAPATSSVAEQMIEALAEMKEHFGSLRVKPRWIHDGLDVFERAIPELTATGTSLRDLGIDELPPAGYVPAPPADEDVLGYAEALFGPDVTVRVCACRADYVAHAVEQSQHLDRIPLDPDNQKGRPEIDVLVPSRRADLKALYIDSYPWLAFVRRRSSDCDCEARVDEVAVYFVDAGAHADSVIAEVLKNKAAPKDGYVTTLRFPADTYAVPIPESDVRDLRTKFTRKVQRRWTAIGLASAEDRQPLAVARAGLLTMSFFDPERETEGPRLAATFDADIDPEAIVIVIGDRRGTVSRRGTSPGTPG